MARRTTKGHMIVDQRDVYADVFSVLMDQEAVEEKYLADCLFEYVKSLAMHEMEVEHFVSEMLIGVLVKHKWYSTLQMLLQYHVVSDSLPVALELLAISQHDCPVAHQLALDMLRRLGKTDVIVDILLARGELLQALRVSDALPRGQLHPKRFLEASLSQPLLFYTVFRHLETRGYAPSPDYVQKFSKEFAIGKTD